MTPDTVILTPNRRLSATLHKLYQQQQLASNKTSWPNPQILPITTWIQFLWDDYTHKSLQSFPLLLNPAQEQFLWEKIILQTRDNAQLLQITETAEQAKSAWSLLKQWEVEIHHPLFQTSEDYLACMQWIKVFQQLCEENDWIDAASLPGLVIKKIISNEISPPHSIMTYGFTEYSPQLKRLFAACETSGSKCVALKAFSHLANTHQMSIHDHELEIETMACFAKSIHEQDQEAKIACVFPDLDKKRDRILQIFSQVFAAENTCTIDPQQAPFNISAGKSLAQTPVIHAALQILSLHKKSISLEVFSHLLTSPFIGEAEFERISRASDEYQLRLKNKNIISLEKISNNKFSPCFQKRLLKVISQLHECQDKSAHAEWANVFCKILSLMGWPGERSLNSEEYQMVESWLNLLTEFSTLDAVSKPVSYLDALHSLKKLAANKMFQAKSPDTPIQILGLLEAAGLPFDYLWVAGLDDISFPPQARPNPFIPRQIQRELQMPHASADRELDFCRTIIQQFIECTAQVIFSHAEKDDELELQASPLIRDFTEISVNDLQLKQYFNPARKIFFTREIECLTDLKAPIVADDEKIRGGVTVIKHQALCPFKSFAEWRLHAREMESVQPGLRAKDRGNVVHQSLELVWNEIKTQARLVLLDDETLDKIIHDAIDTALLKLADTHGESLQYMLLEKKRLKHLLREWLLIEKQRPAFSLLDHEKTVQFKLGPLPLSMRVDRIDQLEDGRKFIIDYKTGKNNDIGKWFGERPEEPQLPLYALLDADNTCGISFAQIHAGEQGFKGVSHYAMEIRGVKVISEITKSTALSWTEQLNQWKEILTRLGTDFYHGVANVDPKDADTCKWCAIKPLCRINEVATEVQQEGLLAQQW